MKLYTVISFVLATVALIGAYMFSSLNSTQKTVVEATVTADVYSGRPNPSWALSQSQIDELNRLVADLVKAGEVTRVPSPTDDLGYRSTEVALKSTSDETTLLARDGVVSIRTKSTMKNYADTQRKIELWLLETGKATISPQLMERITTKLSAQRK
jgi:hypothetical protein